MATYYWVGGAGTWNGTNTANWSTGSGGATGAGPPTNADDVIFDNNSDSGANFQVTLSTTAVCKDFTVASGASLPDRVITFSGTRMAVSGSFTAQNSANNVFTSAQIRLLGAGTHTFTSGARTISSTAFDVQGTGTYTQQDNLTIGSNSSFNFTAGTWDCNNFNINGGNWSSSGTTTREFKAGSGTLTFSGTGPWTATGSNLTFTRGTSTISLSSSTATFDGGGVTYYNVTFTGAAGTSGGGSTSTRAITGANTFNNLTFTAPSSAGVATYFIKADQTIQGTLTASGATAVRRLQVFCDQFDATQRTLSVATNAAMADTDFRGIVVTGTAAPLTGTRIGNVGNNSGITFTAAADKYWNLAGTNTWSATGWALSSGASPAVDNFPLAQDKVIFDNTNAAGMVVNNSAGDFAVGEIDMSARTNTMTLNITNMCLYVCGNITLGTGVTWGGTGSDVFIIGYSGATRTIQPNGQNMNSYFFFVVPSSTVQLLGDLTSTRAGGSGFAGVFLFSGTLDINGYTFVVRTGIDANYTTTRTIAFGSTGVFRVNGTGTTELIVDYDVTNFTVTGSRKIELANAGSSRRYITTGTVTSSNSMDLYVISGTVGGRIGGTGRTVRDFNLEGLTSLSAGNNMLDGMTVIRDFDMGTTYTPALDSSDSGMRMNPGAGETATIRSRGKTTEAQIIINSDATGTTSLVDALNTGTSRDVTVTQGIFTANDQNITARAFLSSNSNTRTVTLGSSTVTCTQTTGNIWNFGTTTGLTFNANTSNIVLAATGASAVTFAGGGRTYNTVTVGGTGTNQINISGSNTFDTLTSTRSVAYTINISTASSTQTITNFTVSGSAGNLVTLARTSGTATLAKAGGGIVSVDYLSISNSTATPATLTWYAGANSTNGGGNSGWIFTAPPATATGNFFQLFSP